MESLTRWLRDIFRRFSDWLDRIGSAGAAGSTEVESATARDVIGAPVEEESTPAQRLSVGQLGIFVLCASCGSLHELEAACHVCGAPLCSDTLNCRLFRYSEDLDQQAIYCPVCVSNAKRGAVARPAAPA